MICASGLWGGTKSYWEIKRSRGVEAVVVRVPDTIEVQGRQHWVGANTQTFRRVMEPVVEEFAGGPAPGFARSLNTATTGGMLAFLGNNVLGQYDPLLLADEPHALYFVHPNIEKVADLLAVDRDRFRRWIAFHEVTHAAEFGAAPWL